jgi:hypothetical protein
MKILSRVEQALVDFLQSSGKASSETLAAVRSGKLRFDERIDYRRYDIGGLSGTQVLVDETVSRQVGLCSIHEGYLPKFVNVAYDKIRFAFKQNGSEITPEADPLYSADVQAFDDALRNGHFILKQDGNPKLEIPVAVCGGAGDSLKATGAEDAYELRNPIIIEENKLITWSIEFANGLTVDDTLSNSHNVEIMLFGVSTRARG